MADEHRRRRTRVATAVVLALLVGTFLTLAAGRGSPEDARPIPWAEAEALLRDAARLARSGDYADLCQSVAASPGTCRFLLDAARQADWWPGPTSPEVYAVSTQATSLILHVRGTRADGSTFTSDFEVIRSDLPNHDGGLRSRTPVYWSGVRVAPAAPCTSVPGQVDCAG